MTKFPLKVTVLGPGETLSGFRYWWLKSVQDYDLSVHCARCLRGPYDRRIGRAMLLNQPVELRGDLVYLCGVSPRWSTNFHAAAERVPGETFDVPTYNGLTVRFENGRQIPIEPLPDGYRGMDKTFTTCRNWQFAVQMSEAITASTSS
jgi:hypothetical protein